MPPFFVDRIAVQSRQWENEGEKFLQKKINWRTQWKEKRISLTKCEKAKNKSKTFHSILLISQRKLKLLRTFQYKKSAIVWPEQNTAKQTEQIEKKNCYIICGSSETKETGEKKT